MLDEAELRSGLSHILRVAPDDIPQEIVDEFIDFDNLTAAYSAAATSDEASATRIVTSYYQVFLGRLPEGTEATPGTDGDESGLTFWVQTLRPQDDDGIQPDELRALAETFSQSEEFLNRYGVLSVESVVREFYLNNLNRDPLSINEATGELSDLPGYEFWVDVTNQRIDQLVESGQFTEEEAVLEAYALLAVDFVFATETQEAVFGPQITELLVGAALDQSDDGFDADGSIFDIQGAFRPVGEQIGELRYQLTTVAVEGATEVVGNTDTDGDGTPDKFVLEGDEDTTNALRLIGNTAIRIDTTDRREQVEGIDIDGSADGVLGDGEVQDGITFDEQDQAFRDAVDVGFFEIFDAHPRGDALLNPSSDFSDPDNAGFTGNIYYDGTGFGGDGVSTNGNIVLGGYGDDVIFTGIGNDFVSTGGGADEVKLGRNADFAVQELSRLDAVFEGQDAELLGGETFDDDAGQDSDWLLIEAGDDEETVIVGLGAPGENNPAQGFLQTTGANSVASTEIGEFENINASGNFYKFLDIETPDVVTDPELEAIRIQFNGATENNIDAFARALTELRVPFQDGDPQTLVLDESTVSPSGLTLADVQNFDDLLALADEVFREQSGTFTDENGDEQPRIVVQEGNALGAPALLVRAQDQSAQDFIVNRVVVEGEFSDGNRPAGVGGFAGGVFPVTDSETIEGAELFDDLFFGDNRDFSEEEAKFRVPNLSPGVTAQMDIVGNADNNIIIAGYDNDSVDAGAGSDLLFGGDLEFLLTHKNNANLFSIDGEILVNAQDGIADDGRDTLIGGTGDDNVVWDADGGSYAGGTSTDTTGVPGVDGETTPGFPADAGDAFGYDNLWVTTFSVGRASDIGLDSTTDASTGNFTAVDGVGIEATVDQTGALEANNEIEAVETVTEDSVLRFDLGAGRGVSYTGNTEEEFRGGLQGANRIGTADQTNYADGFDASVVTDFEGFNATGLGGIDYLAAGTNDPELLFENQQNYRGTNADLDVRGVDEGTEVAPDGLQDVDPFQLDFSQNQLIAGFNLGWRDEDGNDLGNLVYATSTANDVFGQPTDGTNAVKNTDVESAADNTLFTNVGDDVLEGRGGNDWTEAREGDDIFVVTTNDGDNDANPDTPIVDGDNINIIARRLDENNDGLLDVDEDGLGRIGQDFRAFDRVVSPAVTRFLFDATGAYNLEPGDGAPGAPLDDYTELTRITVTFQDPNVNPVEINLNGLRTAAEVAEEVADALGARDVDVQITTDEPIFLGDTGQPVAGRGQAGDGLIIDFDSDEGVADVRAEFNLPVNALGGYASFQDTDIEDQRVLEDDEIVFRSYQDRTDDEGTFDLLASLGLDAYAEDLVIGVENGTTKLVEGQSYDLLFTDLKDGDVVTIEVNGHEFSAEVGFRQDGTDIEGETTAQFITRFVAEINAQVANDPHTSVGNLVATAQDFIAQSPNADATDSANTFGLRLAEGALGGGVNAAQQTFLQFPNVSIDQGSGGAPAEFVVKESSQTSVVLYDYDYRDTSEAFTGLNRGVDQYAQRGDEQSDRFITFEGKSGINRSNIQEAVSGEVLEGLDVVVFDDEVNALEDVAEIRPGLEAALANANDAYLIEDQTILQLTAGGGNESNPGNATGTANPIGDGSSVVDIFSGLGGDDLLRGSIGDGDDSINGRTGDDAILLTGGDDTVDGGVNIVVDVDTGEIQTENGELVQLADDSDDDGDGNVDRRGVRFNDRLVAEANGANGIFAASQFFLDISGVAEDFSLDGTFSTDENRDGTIDHVTAASNIELFRTLNKDTDDVLTFSVEPDEDGVGIDYNNSGGLGAIDLTPGDPATEGTGFVQGFGDVTGTAGNDDLTGGNEDETLSGGDGNDLIIGGAGSDSLSGGNGDDIILGGDDEDRIEGDAGDDLIQGGNGDDELFGGEGDDLISNLNVTALLGLTPADGDVIDNTGNPFFGLVDGGADIAFGGSGGDTVINISDDAADSLQGNDGFDSYHVNTSITGLVDEDTLDGGSGFDVLNVNAFGLGPKTVTFFPDPDGTDDDDEALTVELLVVFPDSFETVEITVAATDFDPTDPAQIADDFAEEARALGFDALQGAGATADSVTLTPTGDQVTLFVNQIRFTGDSPAGTSDQGAGATADLRDATVTNFENVNSNGGQVIISGSTFANIAGVTFSGVNGVTIAATTAEANAGEGAVIENFLTPGNADSSSNILGSVVLEGTEGNDTMTGGDVFTVNGAEVAFSDVINGNGGDDVMNGLGGNDTLNGGDGDDTGNGGAGNDQLFGNVGDDVLDGGAGDDFVSGGADNDQLSGGTGDDNIVGGGGDDTITAGPADLSDDQEADGITDNDAVNGGDGADSIDGGDGADQLTGGDGNDTVDGGQGNDTISGDADRDSLSGGDGDDNINGGTENDTLDGGAGVDFLDGGDDDDVLTGGAGTDQLIGGQGDDNLSGGADNDQLDGGDGQDTINGGDGDDVLVGGAGDDTLNGGGGNDAVDASEGSDTVDVGQGNDTVTLEATTNGDAIATINNFATGADDDILNVLVGGTPVAGAFQTVTAAGTNLVPGFVVVDTSGTGLGAEPASLAAADVAQFFADQTTTATAGTIIVALAADGNTGLFAIDSDGGDITEAEISQFAVLNGVGNAAALTEDNVEGFAPAPVATPGPDNLVGTAGDDTIDGLAGDDTIDGAGGNDQLQGNADNDILTGSGGNDILEGGDGNDSLSGGIGADTMNGDAGDDVLTGGLGADQFDFLYGGEGLDTVTDFTSGTDTFAFVGASDVTGITAGNETTVATADGTAAVTLDNGLTIIAGANDAASLSAADVATLLTDIGGGNAVTGPLGASVSYIAVDDGTNTGIFQVDEGIGGAIAAAELQQIAQLDGVTTDGLLEADFLLS